MIVEIKLTSVFSIATGESQENIHGAFFLQKYMHAWCKTLQLLQTLWHFNIPERQKESFETSSETEA